MRWNQAVGIPDLLFAVGDSAITLFIQGISFLPLCIMVCITFLKDSVGLHDYLLSLLQYMLLCPEGSEGVTYALLSTMNNLASAMSSDIGTGLTLLFDVSNDTLQSGDYSGVLKLVVLTRYFP